MKKRNENNDKVPVLTEDDLANDEIPPGSQLKAVAISPHEARVLVKYWAKNWRRLQDLNRACCGYETACAQQYAGNRPDAFLAAGLISDDEVAEIFDQICESLPPTHWGEVFKEENAKGAEE